MGIILEFYHISGYFLDEFSMADVLPVKSISL